MLKTASIIFLRRLIPAIGIALAVATPALAATACPKLSFFPTVTLSSKKTAAGDTICDFGKGDKGTYKHGVLGCVPVDKDAKITDNGQAEFFHYVAGIHTLVMPYVFLGALIFIVFAGIQYMTAGYGAGSEKKAKEQIIGVVTGIVFYFLLIVVYNWFVCVVAAV
jgi:hypothetical protein